MIIKKFTGKTEEEAMLEARLELGDNIVKMNVKQVKRKGLFGFFRKKLIEITVGQEEEQDTTYVKMNEAVSAIRDVVLKEEMAPTFKPENKPRKMEPLTASKAYEGVTYEKSSYTKNNMTSSSSYNRSVEKTTYEKPIYEKPTYEKPSSKPLYDAVKIKSGESTSNIEEKLESLHTLIEKQLVKENKESDTKEEGKNSEFFKLIYNTLIDNEVNEKYVNELIEDAEKINKDSTSIEQILANMYQKMILKFGKNKLITEGEKNAKVIFFIGPTGVGKTTTIAKIASKLILDKKKVALLTTDTYRIAATDQLAKYAEILKAPFKVIYTTDELKDNIKSFESYDYIVVDTAGHAHNNEAQKSGTKQFLDCVSDENEKLIYLVLSATTKYRDLKSVCDSYSEYTKYSLIFTKLDETSTLGNLYNLKLYTKADMSYVTFGQDVPDDIEEFSPQSTVKQLLGGK